MRKFLVGICVLSCIASNAQRTETLLEKGWKFTREDNAQFSNIDVEDAKWQSVVVPHDWAIYGPFSSQNDKQNVAILQDGQKEALEHAGRTGGLPFVGVGWYRLQFDAPKSSEGKQIELLFDGAMSEPQVFVNGQKAGEWKYGYNSFVVDITNFVSENGKNTLAVRLENMPESSRWYPGAGIYRNVHLIVTEKTHIPVWGTCVTTPVVSEEYAKVSVRTNVKYTDATQWESLKLKTTILDAQNNVVATEESSLNKYEKNTFEQNFILDKPALWSVENPNLYIAKSEIFENGEL
ncbi:MAG: beta galactosidase jelly roll domain-containing protein, partial [Paludibacteraceae bacterium]|nr:beta galactosidase jelly roll domain-containing protein [Paludibacteraceae bacterium]